MENGGRSPPFTPALASSKAGAGLFPKLRQHPCLALHKEALGNFLAFLGQIMYSIMPSNATTGNITAKA